MGLSTVIFRRGISQYLLESLLYYRKVPPMSKIVFILGAGASKQAGGPLMGEFIEAASRIHERGNDPEAKAFNHAFNGIHLLRQANSKSRIDLANIESVYGAFDIAHLCRKLGDLAEEEILALPGSLRTVITRTLELNIPLPRRNDKAVPPEPYDRFGELIRDLREKDRNQVSLLTFNYGH
jgi:hypothetical protein